MEGEVRGPSCLKNRLDGSGAVGCIGLPLGRFGEIFLCVSAAERLANAIISRICGCFCRRWVSAKR